MKLFLALAFAGAFAFQAHAQNPEQGIGLVCDTKEQVEQFSEQMNGGATAQDSIAKINDQSNRACGILHIAWTNEAVVARVTINNSVYELISMVVVGINSDGWKPIPPTVQFGLKRTLDRGA